ncbi:MAG: YhbY family RNA-binding protein [Spirochaetes bacterium]|nr:YhbY family RNA-binding protein [Spirochaetota bacterium]
MMLTSRQRARLAALAGTLDPIVHLGKGGLTDAVKARLATALDDHELVKLRFVDFQGAKRALALDLAGSIGAELVRIIGNVAVFWRESTVPERRKGLLDEELPPEKPRSIRKKPEAGSKDDRKSGAGKGKPAVRKPGAKYKKKKAPRRMMGPGR